MSRTTQIGAVRWPPPVAPHKLRPMRAGSKTTTCWWWAGCAAVMVLGGCAGSDTSATGDAGAAVATTLPEVTAVATAASATVAGPTTTVAVPTTAGPTTTVAVPTTASVPPVAPRPAFTDPRRDVVRGLFELQHRVLACLAEAARCDLDDVTVPGSPARAALGRVRDYYLANDLTVVEIPALSYVVPERVEILDADRAVVTLCEVDGNWQMDRRGTADPADDVVWNDRLVSRRAVHVLVRSGDRWRRQDLDELEVWQGENRCPAAV